MNQTQDSKDDGESRQIFLWTLHKKIQWSVTWVSFYLTYLPSFGVGNSIEKTPAQTNEQASTQQHQ